MTGPEPAMHRCAARIVYSRQILTSRGDRTITYRSVVERLVPAERSRRAVVVALGAGLGLIAGCIGEDGSSDSGEEQPDIPEVEVGADDHSLADALYRFDVTYHARTTDAIPRHRTDIRPTDGHKFVVVFAEVRVSSARDGSFHVPDSIIGLDANNTVYEARQVPNEQSFARTVVPPASYEGLAYFELPNEIAEATLVARSPETHFGLPAEIVFEHDPTRWLSG